MEKDRIREIVREVVSGLLDERKNPAERTEPPREGVFSSDPLFKRVALWADRAVTAQPPSGKLWKPSADRDGYLKSTPARLGVGRTGTRYRTGTLMKFLADHAAARDAVYSELPDEIINGLKMTKLSSAAKDRAEFLRRPDLGRRLSDESRNIVASQFIKSPQVQIVAGDGLSAAALKMNLGIVIPALISELAQARIKIGTLCYIRLARVAAGDETGLAAGADVVCMLVGERPGLKTAESMGAYIMYLKGAKRTDAQRSVVSNIHDNGIKPAEAGQIIAKLCLKILKAKKSGVDLGSKE
ncbi:MAG: ethanolamine ammonia-lyase subunit EutC [Deltaproteobacteria bacterium]|nr:ethanolamine ammonia-lyase subunit EutC [Deltaproteobacteria bacterium]